MGLRKNMYFFLISSGLFSKNSKPACPFSQKATSFYHTWIQYLDNSKYNVENCFKKNSNTNVLHNNLSKPVFI